MAAVGATLLATSIAGSAALAQEGSAVPMASAAPGGEATALALKWAPLLPLNAPPFETSEELADGFALGAADAPVEVEVWADFQCPYCQRFTFQVEPMIISEYVETGKARLVFRSLAFLGLESQWAALAAGLAADQNRFWPFHDYLFANLEGENRGSFGLERFQEIAEAIGMDMGAFRQGLQLENARERFASLYGEAQADAAALGINATPTVTVDGVVLESPDFETVSAAIDEAYADASDQGAADGGPAPQASAEGSEDPEASTPETEATQAPEG